MNRGPFADLSRHFVEPAGIVSAGSRRERQPKVMLHVFKKSSLLAGAALVFPLASAFAQETPPVTQQPAAEEAPFEDEAEDEGEEIIVVGARPRGSVIGDIPPENTLNSRDVRATGATDITELLEALAPQIGSARGRGGERPILLLNGQRISSFRELRDIPTEGLLGVREADLDRTVVCTFDEVLVGQLVATGSARDRLTPHGWASRLREARRTRPSETQLTCEHS